MLSSNVNAPPVAWGKLLDLSLLDLSFLTCKMGLVQLPALQATGSGAGRAFVGLSKWERAVPLAGTGLAPGAERLRETAPALPGSQSPSWASAWSCFPPGKRASDRAWQGSLRRPGGEAGGGAPAGGCRRVGRPQERGGLGWGEGGLRVQGQLREEGRAPWMYSWPGAWGQAPVPRPVPWECLVEPLSLGNRSPWPQVTDEKTRGAEAR